MMKMGNKDIVILGAGIAGLGAGYKLAEHGYTVKLIEAEEYIGGQATSFRYKDCIFDFGPHGFHSTKQELLQFFFDLMGDEIIIFQKKVKIKFKNILYDYPLKPTSLLKSFEKKVLIECGLSFLANLFISKRKGMDESLENFFISLYGKKLYNIFFENYTQKVWGYHPRDLSNSFLKYRLPRQNLIQMALEALKDIKNLNKNRLTTEKNIITYGYYPGKGSIRFPEKLKDKIVSNNGQVVIKSPVKKIHIKNNKVEGITILKNGKEEEVHSDLYISTIPLTKLIESISPSPDDEIIQVSKNLKYRAIIIVCVVIDTDKVIDADINALYFHHRIFNRLGQMNSFSKETVPEGKSALTLEISCFKGDDIWNMDEEVLFNKVLDELEEEGFGIRNKVEGYFMERTEYGYPIPLLSYENLTEKIFMYLNKISNLYVTGRQGLFSYIQMYQALDMGFKVAGDIMEGVQKPPQDVWLKQENMQYI